jgi:hypothetical protein
MNDAGRDPWWKRLLFLASPPETWDPSQKLRMSLFVVLACALAVVVVLYFLMTVVWGSR